MLIDSFVPFEQKSLSPRERAVGAFIAFLERKLGVRVVRDARRIPYGRIDLLTEFEIAKTLTDAGIIKSFSKLTPFPDEPPFKRWSAVCADSAKHPTGGASFWSDSQALRATLAEALERYLWTEARNHFISPFRGTAYEAEKRGPFVAPERFAGFSDGQRRTNQSLRIDSETSFLWTQGESHVTGKPVYVPVQTVSGIRGVRENNGKREPLLRTIVTTGLATWPEKKEAVLRGALEVIERDAYMIWWLNQIPLPRIALEAIEKEGARLSEIISWLSRYRMKMHALRLPTDAPAHAICAVIEDESDVAPHFAFGLKAHRSLARAVEGAALEALRAHSASRHRAKKNGPWNPSTPLEKIGHLDRIDYWALPQNARELEKFVRTQEQSLSPEPWNNDSVEEHLQRIIQWCRDEGYELASVSLGSSSLNPTPWNVEVVVIPELQPTHLFENLQSLGGKRLKLVPEKLGYVSRETPYTSAPHPFA